MDMFDGKTVTIRTDRNGKMLCAIDQPEPGSAEKSSWQITEDDEKMAFHFISGSERYCTKVVGESVKVEKASCCDINNISEDHWFVKYSTGNGIHSDLRPLSNTRRCLSFKKKRPYNAFLRMV